LRKMIFHDFNVSFNVYLFLKKKKNILKNND